MTSEERYIQKRKVQAFMLSLRFYLMRVFPINRNKIVVSTFEGDGGFCCNPRYIVEKLLESDEKLEIVWLTNDVTRPFPKSIKVVKNTKWNVAFHLATGKIWIDNYRKPYGTKKRKGQYYIQTWHASLGFKAVGLFRGDQFPRIARIISEADSKLADFFTSNSDYCTRIYPKKLLYTGPVLQVGSPRCDCVINEKNKLHKEVRTELRLSQEKKLLLFAPTFRGGNQKGNKVVTSEIPSVNFDLVIKALHEKFGGEWLVLLRLHPQLSATMKNMPILENREFFVDVSQYPDVSRLIASCDALITDYSSCAFDAAFGEIPVFLYADDVEEYLKTRGRFMWNEGDLPFSLAQNNSELLENINNYDQNEYRIAVNKFCDDLGVVENGTASQQVADVIKRLIQGNKSMEGEK